MQFDIHRNADANSKHVPYLLDVQSDLLSGVPTRIVVPMVRAAIYGKAESRLCPLFEIEGVKVIMLTTDIAGVEKSEIGARVGSLAERRDDIRDALDFAFQGF